MSQASYTAILVAIFLLVPRAFTQNAQATVVPPSVTIRAKPSADSSTVATLRRGDIVSVDFRMTGDAAGPWCSITFGQESQTGYVRCSDLHQRQPATQPSAATRIAPSSVPTTSEAAINEALSLSGIEKQFQQLANVASVGEALRARGLGPAEAAQAAQAMHSAFTPEVFLRPIRQQLRVRADPALLRKVLEWYRTPLAQRVTAAETRATAPENAQRFFDFVRRLPNQPPPAERVALVRRLDAVADLSEIQYAVVRAVLRGIAARVNPTLAPKKRLDESRLESLMRTLEQQRPAFKELTLARYLYMYQTVSDYDLREYIAFWETDAGRWFRDASFRGGLEGIEMAALRMVDLLIQAMPNRRAPGGLR
ncbi:MAG TPA: SH3 domain-containing protein [Bryobacteraceae bacterium]|nr:SH3 domain-containing protein [Bryobacteraceae bacterium]